MLKQVTFFSRVILFHISTLAAYIFFRETLKSIAVLFDRSSTCGCEDPVKTGHEILS